MMYEAFDAKVLTAKSKSFNSCPTIVSILWLKHKEMTSLNFIIEMVT